MDMIHWGSLDISIVDTAVYDNPILAYKWFYFTSETTNYNVWIIKGVKMIRVDLKKYESPEGSFEIGDSKFDILNTIIREFKWNLIMISVVLAMDVRFDTYIQCIFPLIHVSTLEICDVADLQFPIWTYIQYSSLFAGIGNLRGSTPFECTWLNHAPWAQI